MSIDVIKRNKSNCKYVEMFTHRVGSEGASRIIIIIIKILLKIVIIIIIIIITAIAYYNK
jgi:hypothetical protein